MIRIRNIFALLLLALIVTSASPAFSGPSFPTPTWCYRYTSTDAFNNPGAWSQWDNAAGGIISIGSNPDARSPSKAASMIFDSLPDVPGAFLLIDRLFTPTQNLTESFRRTGCATNVPIPTPAGPAISCEAKIWVRPYLGIHGSIQLIDNSTWTYLAGEDFVMSSSPSWQLVSVASANCPAEMVVRIVANKSPAGAPSMDVDDLSLVRYYY